MEREMSETAFEKWWIDQHGPNWKANFAEWEKEHCEVAWNSAIDAAINECDNWIKIMDGSCGYGLDDCKAEIQKLRSE
jgi:hypothetical protein